MFDISTYVKSLEALLKQVEEYRPHARSLCVGGPYTLRKLRKVDRRCCQLLQDIEALEAYHRNLSNPSGKDKNLSQNLTN